MQNLGVDWYLPNAKRRFASTTVATSNLLSILAEEGVTFNEARKMILFDNDAVDVVEHFIKHGYGEVAMRDMVRIY